MKPAVRAWSSRLAAAALLLLVAVRFGPRGSIAAGLVLSAWAAFDALRRRSTDSAAEAGEARRTAEMDRTEALRVLGLGEGATPEDVRSAHRNLIKKLHPDQGGSGFLAQQVNEAKEVLLRR